MAGSGLDGGSEGDAVPQSRVPVGRRAPLPLDPKSFTLGLRP